MPLEAPELVRAAMDAVEETTHAGLARRLPFDKPGYGPQRVARWLRGDARPNYEQTIALLDLAGWLNVTGAATTDRRTGDVASAAILPALRQIGDGLETLEALVSGQSQQAPQRRRRSASQ